MLNLFVNTWGNYNKNGADGGQWITLPMDPDELEEVLENIAALMGDHDPEWAIHDYEWTSEIEMDEISEYANIFEVNTHCMDLDDLEQWEAEEIAAAVDAYGYSFKDALDRHQRGCFIFYQGLDLEEVAEEIVNEYHDLPELALCYFDYKAFARDLRFDGYEETKWGVIVDC